MVNTLVDCALHTASITELEAGLLQATSASSYQWLLNGEPIPGAVDPTFQALATGDYRVITTSAFYCVATSEPVFVATTSVAQPMGALIGVRPNPFHGTTTLVADRPLDQTTTIEVLDATGRLAHRLNGSRGTHVVVNVGALSPGLYLLRVLEANAVIGAMRVVVE